MNLPWYIPVAIAFVAGLLLGWQGCERSEPCPECPKIEIVNEEVFPKEPTVVIKEPEVKPPTGEKPGPQITYVEHPSHEILKRRYDSLATAFNALSTYREYRDSIDFENLVVFYRGETLGYLEDIDIGIIDNRPTKIETRIITPPAEIKYAKGIYLGVTIGGNKSEFGTLGVGGYYVNRKIIAGYNYNVIDGGHNIMVARKLFGF